MSDDQFLHQFRKPPRREFSRALYERLKQEGEPMTSMMTPLPRSIHSANGIYHMPGNTAAKRHTNRWTIAAAVLALIVFGGVLIYMIYPQPEETPLVLAPMQQQRETVISTGSARNLTEVATLGRGNLNGATWSPDGSLLALFGSMGVWIYDADDLETPLYHIPVTTNYMAAVYFSPDGSQLIYADQEGIAIWDRATQDARHISREDQFSLGVVAFSPDGRLLATGDFEGNIRIWDVATGELKSDIRVFYNYVPILSMVFNADSTHLAFTGSDTPVLILEDATAEWQDFAGDPLVFDPGSRSEAGITSLSFNADGSRVTARVYTEIVVWDVATGEEIARFDTAPEPEPEATAISSGFGGGGGGGGSAKGGGSDLTFSPDGTQIATVDDSIRIWDIATGESRTLVEREANDYSTVGYVDFSPDWSKLAIVDPITSEVKIIDMATGEVLAAQANHNYRPVMNLIFPDSDTLITMADNTVMRTWDLTTASDESLPINTVTLNDGAMMFGFQAISISPDRRQYAAFAANEIEIHDATTGEIIRTLDNPGQPSMYMSSSNLAYSPDGTLLAGIGPQTNIVRLWDVATGEIVREAVIDGFVGSVAFSPDGSRLGVTTLPADYYTSAAPGQPVFGVQIFDTATLDTVATLIGHLDTVFQMSFSPDGSQLATFSNDGTLRLWDVEAGQEQFMLTSATSTSSFAFSPDGTLLATADYNQDTQTYAIRFWDLRAETPQPIIALENLGTINTLAFSPDGTLLAIAYTDGSTQLWAAE